ncbi:neuropeptide FF receptor 1-like [Branchiostoma floridae]|uniref:Neuropeptide FF receptor 1-like n=2 Tax=Branchiostoma floridae TaxID=7739 RepID=A0A9J7LCW5_BRAFL|nr:neuropeptide FF receptor 1-like [Branchiostoma floridae]
MDTVMDYFWNISTTPDPENLSDDVVNHTWATSEDVTSRLKHDIPITGLFIVSYGLVFLFSLGGNVGLCIVVLKYPRLRTVTNYFLLNLAVGDIMVTVCCMPFTLVDNILVGYAFSEAICRLSRMIEGVSVAASVLGLSAVAFYRYRAIVHPQKPKMTRRRAYQLIVISWLVSLFIMLPMAFVLNGEYLQYEGYKVYICKEEWPTIEYNQAFTTTLFVFVYFLPVMSMAVMYGEVSRKLWGRQQVSRSSQRYSDRARKRAQVTKMLIMIVVLFALSWLPLWVLQFLQVFGHIPEYIMRVLLVYVVPVAHWLGYCNCLVNPIVYGYFNRDIRRQLQSPASVTMPTM